MLCCKYYVVLGCTSVALRYVMLCICCVVLSCRSVTDCLMLSFACVVLCCVVNMLCCIVHFGIVGCLRVVHLSCIV